MQSDKSAKRKGINGIKCLAYFFTPNSGGKTETKFFYHNSGMFGHQKMPEFMNQNKNR